VILTSVILILLAVLGAPLFAVIASSAMLGFSRDDIDLITVAIEILGMADLQFLTAIPLFTFAGYILSESNAPKRLVRMTGALIGWMPSGLPWARCFTLRSSRTVTPSGSILGWSQHPEASACCSHHRCR
jgi:TRAP-type mannitol/chloroaromatic compound transport system permease large subunit